MSSPVSSLTASRSPSPEPPVQPDHFYGADPSHLPPSPSSSGKTYLSPDDDPLAHRGIPVFAPTMAEFADFEAYMEAIEPWGRHSGIVKVIPPKEWSSSLPDVTPQLANVKIKSPIEQFMRGRGGLFRQENVEKRKLMSVREWAELCAKDEFRAPGKDQVGVHNSAGAMPALRRRRKTKTKEEEAKDEEKMKAEQQDTAMASPPNSASPDPEDATDSKDTPADDRDTKEEEKDTKADAKRNRRTERVEKDATFLQSFTPHTDWLPPATTPADYTPEFCQKLERAFWRNCGLGKPAWYGADTMGSLFERTLDTWNVARLPSTLSRLLPSTHGLPGVNTPYLYFGMWRATFAWHVEDMDLFSINYIHFGAPKFWYAVPQARAGALEGTMRGYFPKDTSSCPQFLRHKSFLASPTLLAQSAVRPNHLVQHAGEFVVTYPRGYHAGFNLGFNCAESVNFALESWIDEGRRAGVCACVDDSVRIDVDQLLEDRRIEALEKTDPEAAAAARRARDGVDLESYYDAEMPPPADSSASASASGGKGKGKDVKGKQKDDGKTKEENKGELPRPRTSSPRKRKPTAPFDPDAAPAAKRARVSSGSGASHPTHMNGHGHNHAQAHTYSRNHANANGTPAPHKVTLILPARPHSSSSHSHHSAYPQPLAIKPPAEEEIFPCCLCVGPSTAGLARVHDLPVGWREVGPAARVWYASDSGSSSGNTGGQGVGADEQVGQGDFLYTASATPHSAGVWMAHESCALVLPETWVDEVGGERIVFGVDGIVRGRWALKCAACPRPRAKAHGALIQCTKGKCPKAFHISCAASGGPAGIAYSVLREVEKEVVLLEPPPAPLPATDPIQPVPEPTVRVLKVIRKAEVEVLCAQHNPKIVAERRASKAESVRADVLALPPLARIKIRVSAGVFEVTLMRVLEARRSVEVLWDAGEVREFKWGSILLGASHLPTTTFPAVAPNAASNSTAASGSGPQQASASYYGHHVAYPNAPPPYSSSPPRNPAASGSLTWTEPSNLAAQQNPYSSLVNTNLNAHLSATGQNQGQGHNQNAYSSATNPANANFMSSSGNPPAAQHNPYSSLVNATPDATAQSVFKYQYWHPSGVYGGDSKSGPANTFSHAPTNNGASTKAGPSSTPNTNPSTSLSASTSAVNAASAAALAAAALHAPGSHYVSQYYTGPQPWSSQYYRTPGTGAGAGQGYYPAAQFQAHAQQQQASYGQLPPQAHRQQQAQDQHDQQQQAQHGHQQQVNGNNQQRQQAATAPSVMPYSDSHPTQTPASAPAPPPNPNLVSAPNLSSAPNPSPAPTPLAAPLPPLANIAPALDPSPMHIDPQLSAVPA